MKKSVKRRSPKTVQESQITIHHLVTPPDLNFRGFLFGGVMLKLIDQAAFVCARKHSGSYCVTASFDRVDFKDVIHMGELITLHASVNYVGKTSMEIGVKVTAEDFEHNRIRHTNSSYVTMVAVDEKGRPVPVPSLKPETTEEIRRYKEGEARYLTRKAETKKKQPK
ncbi:acyl-CoA thioesterase [Candidatus Peregrinibacteria bacterium]|nr:acyl-CoA thioesterase [Candidatus Peregrinibacteria bacterium]